MERQREPALGLGHLSVVTREVSSTTSEAIVRSAKSPRLADALAVAVPVSRVFDLVLDDAAAAAQLAQAVEVAEQRHVGVGRVVRFFLPPSPR